MVLPVDFGDTTTSGKQFINYAFDHSDAFMLLVKHANRPPFDAETFLACNEQELRQLPDWPAVRERWLRVGLDSWMRKKIFEQECLPFLEKLRPFLIKTRAEISPEWPAGQMITDDPNECVIHVYRTDPAAKPLLLEADGYISWRHPKLPEDLCFFSQNRCWACACSHEEFVWIYPRSAEEYETLSQIGVPFLHTYIETSREDYFFESY